MDDTAPATKGDIQRLEQTTKGDIQRLEQTTKGEIQRLEQRMDERFNNMHEDIDRILGFLVQNKETLNDHEKRIVRLEKAVA